MAVVDSLSDPYAALGVTSDASPATIRSSYKKLMLQCHPDKVRDEAQKAEKAALYEKVQQAYELLSDNRKRRKYDEEVARSGNPAAAAARANGVPPPPKNGAAPPGTTPPSDGFGSRDREKEREKRHERRRQRQEEDARRSREESFGGEDPYQSRRSSGHNRYRERESEPVPRSQSYHESRHGHTQEIPIPRSTRRESTFPGSSTSYRYSEEPSPRGNSYEPKSYETKNSYDSSQGFQGYRPSPPRQSVPEEPVVGSVREGYVETKMTEQQKLDEVRRKINGGAPPMTSSRTSRSSGSHDDDPERLAQRQRARDAEAMRRQESELRRQQEAQMQAQAAVAERFRQEQAAQAQAEMLRQQQLQAAAAAERERIAAVERAAAAERMERERSEREKREKERREKKVAEKNRSAQEKLAERMGRSQNLATPTNRTRKTSSSPSIGRRRGSSTVSRDDSFPHRTSFQSTGEGFSSIESTIYGSSLPHLQTQSDRVLRRRHSVSSPSLEKQNARQMRDSQPVQTPDSGYSSPSSPPMDTPPSFAKKTSSLNPNTTPPAMVRSTDRSAAPPPAPASSNGTAEPPQQGDHQWKQYTVRVLVRDDGVTQTVPVTEPTDDIPSALSSIPTSAPLGRKLSSSTSSVTNGSPGTVHAEPMLGCPPSVTSSVFGDTAYIASRAINLPTAAFYPDSVHGASPSGAAYKTSSYAGSASHLSQSHHSSSPRHRSERHHSSSSHHHSSPKIGADGFTSPRSSRRSTAAPMDYGNFVQPSFVRGQTWNGPS